jgi:predicted nucleic acid-binding protein
VNVRPVYLDASAIVKLVVAEPQSGALADALQGWPDWLSSALAEVEVYRALWRVGAPRAVHARAEEVLSGLVLVHIDGPVLSRASSFKDHSLRALDAIHLATALSIGDAPEAFITYDARLAAAARRQRLDVRHPGVVHLAAQPRPGRSTHSK